jgi:hypothetical protein
MKSTIPLPLGLTPYPFQLSDKETEFIRLDPDGAKILGLIVVVVVGGAGVVELVVAGIVFLLILVFQFICPTQI